MLPSKDDIVELDRALEQAAGILIRMHLNMTSHERNEFPKLYSNIEKAEGLMIKLGDSLKEISTELGIGPLR